LKERKNKVVTIYSKPEQTEKKHFKGSDEASAADKALVGGEKFMQIDNVLFQSDADAGTMATALLARLKDKKSYYEMASEFCPVPVEIRDSITAEERVTSTKDVNHTGLLRGIRLFVVSELNTIIIRKCNNL